MGKRIPLVGEAEQDALTGWRKVLSWKAGGRKLIKRKYNRRERRQVRRDLLQSKA